MNIATVAHAFFLFSGALLILIALMQLSFRKRAKDSSTRRFDASVVRMLLFTSVGIFAILVGLGVIPMGPPR
jgi:bacteriorhodopsin